MCEGLLGNVGGFMSGFPCEHTTSSTLAYYIISGAEDSGPPPQYSLTTTAPSVYSEELYTL